jgi:hypothetical protein
VGVFISNSVGAKYKLSLCHTPIKLDLLGFPRIGVFACGLCDHVITRFASNMTMVVFKSFYHILVSSLLCEKEVIFNTNDFLNHL